MFCSAWEENFINVSLDFPLLRVTEVCVFQNATKETMITGCFILDRN